MTRVLPALALLLALPVSAQTGDPALPIRVDPDGIAELVFGVYCAEPPARVEEAPDTATGILNIVPRLPDIRFAQQVVPAAVGIGFGVLSRATPGVVHDPVTVTVTHPPYPDSGISVETWVTTIDDLDLGLTGFSFDTEGELVTGTWSFTATTGTRELYHVSFDVVPPELAGQVMATCQMAYTS